MIDEGFVLQELQAASAPLRVALVTETYPPEVNGVAMTLSRMVDGLQRRSHRVQLIRPRQSSAEHPVSSDRLEEVLKPGIAIPRYDGLRMGLPAKQALYRLWNRKRPDVVHIATEGPLGWSALAAALKLKLPVSTGFHTNFHSYSRHYGAAFMKRPISAYLRKFHNRALATMVPTDELRRELDAQGFRNLHVVARGVDTRLFSPAKRSAELRAQWGVADDVPVALYVGRLAPEKNLKLVVEAYAAMRAAGSPTVLVMVGDGPARKEFQSRFPEIRFADARAGEDLAAHYASADLFLFPSMTETFGNVTMEAMASGLAVLAYDYAAARQHIRHETSGLLAPFGDAASFVRLATGLVADAPRLNGLRLEARKVAERVDWEQVFADFEGVLHDVVRRQELVLA